jgi:hypothetical protein
MTPAPIPCLWTGDTFVPLKAFERNARAAYGAGEVVTLVPHEARSQASHGHYFARLQDIWQSLPEDQTARFINEECFRKHGLIATGYRDERSIVCASKAEAQRVAAFVKPMDEYAIVTVREAVVTVYTAKSQSMRAMGRETFQKSKDDVLAWAEAFIEIDRSQEPGGVNSPSRVAGELAA